MFTTTRWRDLGVVTGISGDGPVALDFSDGVMTAAAADSTGRWRVVATVPGSGTTRSAVVSGALIRASGRCADITVEVGTECVVRDTRNGTVYSAGLVSAGVPRPADVPTDEVAAAEFVAALGLAGAAESDRDDVPFRHLVITADTTVAGVGQGRLVAIGPGVLWVTGVVRVPVERAAWLAGVVRGRSVIGVGGVDRLVITTPDTTVEIPLWRDALPLERFSDPGVVSGFRAALGSPVEIDASAMARLVRGFDGPVELVAADGMLSATTPERSDSIECGSGTLGVAVPADLLVRGARLLSGVVALRASPAVLMMDGGDRTVVIRGVRV